MEYYIYDENDLKNIIFNHDGDGIEEKERVQLQG